MGALLMPEILKTKKSANTGHLVFWMVQFQYIT